VGSSGRALYSPLAASAGGGGSWTSLVVGRHSGVAGYVGVSNLDDTGWSRARCSIRRTNTPPGGVE
jgi:hypothetical protein